MSHSDDLKYLLTKTLLVTHISKILSHPFWQFIMGIDSDDVVVHNGCQTVSRLGGVACDESWVGFGLLCVGSMPATTHRVVIKGTWVWRCTPFTLHPPPPTPLLGNGWVTRPENRHRTNRIRIPSRSLSTSSSVQAFKLRIAFAIASAHSWFYILYCIFFIFGHGPFGALEACVKIPEPRAHLQFRR